MTFNADRLKELRTVKPGSSVLSVEKLEEISGVSHSALTKAENGRSVPNGNNIAAIAKALDAPMNYFYEEGRDPNPAASAARMSFEVFAADKNFMTVEQRRRCIAALKHKAAPRTAEGWRDFCEMVAEVFASQELQMVNKGKR
jgi:transcriptional regulator with XRE-family HTH domain